MVVALPGSTSNSTSRTRSTVVAVASSSLSRRRMYCSDSPPVRRGRRRQPGCAPAAWPLGPVLPADGLSGGRGRLEKLHGSFVERHNASRRSRAGALMLVVISGCSGGGKSTLLVELACRGYAVIEEAGRRIIEQERVGDGSALPCVHAEAFGRRALAMSVADHEAAQGLTFFDRGVVDAAVAITARGGDLPAAIIAAHRYDRLFLAPPWPEIYENDADRRHSLEAALRDYERVRKAYLDAGYQPVMLPRDTISARADFVVANCQGGGGRSPE